MSRVSVLVASINRAGHLKECVQTILDNDYPDFELLILDQSTGDETARAIESFADSRIRYFHLDKPGKSRALNFGLRQSVGEILCFTDDDCLPSPTWISAILREFDAAPELSMVLGQTFPKFILPTIQSAFACFESPRRRLYHGRRSPYEIGGAGGNMSFRRQAILKLGPFDENLGPGSRFKAVMDNEYFHRVFSLGMWALYSPDVVVFHKQWRERSEVGRIDRNYRFGNAAFIGKFLSRGDPWPLYYFLSLNLHRTGEGILQFKPRKIRRSFVAMTFFAWGLAGYFRELGWGRRFDTWESLVTEGDCSGEPDI